MKKAGAVMLSLLVCLVIFTSCGDTPRTKTTMALDTVCAVTVYEARCETLVDTVMAHIARREALWSRTVKTSDIARLNAANGEAVTVDADTAALLRTAVEQTARTAAFDVTTATLTDLWKSAAARGALPTEGELAAALDTVGADKLVLDGTRVTLTDGAGVDLGGIAKGRIADEAAAILLEGGCHSALIDLGGNIVAVGAHPNGDPFTVGIAHPTKDNALAATVAVTNGAVVTSGSYQRGYEIGGVWYSHILDPKTGQPVQNDLLSVTILAASACEADALSTACFVMGYEAARAFVDSTEGVEAVFVLTDGRVVATSGVDVV